MKKAPGPALSRPDVEGEMKNTVSPSEPHDVVARYRVFRDQYFWLWTTAVIGVTAVFSLQDAFSSLIGPISNILPAGGASVAFISALLTWRRYGLRIKPGFEAIWFSFTLGMGLWIVAEVTWAAYYFVLNVPVPYPSVADYFYIGGYLPILVGLVLYLKIFSGALSRGRLIVSVAAIGVAFALALGLVLPVELSQNLGPLTVLTDLAYPVLDLALFSISVLCLAIFLGGSISKWWILFGGASLLYAVGDEYFLLQVSAGTYYNGSLDDLVFILGYLTFAFAFYVHRREF